MFVLLTLALPLPGQESPIHNQTTAPADARFEIVQSQTAAKWTFRLDRYTGRIWQLTRTPSGGNVWQEMEVRQAETAPENGRPRFQVFLSGLAARHSFLIDTENGHTWFLATLVDDHGKEQESVWTPFGKDV